MEQKTLTATATASLTAMGLINGTGSITWTAPSLPEGATGWDSIYISGTWSWGGRGSITRVTINGTNTSKGVPFNISIAGKESPLSITCAGNINAIGSKFTWSNLIVTYVCTIASGDKFMIKVNNIWKEVTVYKKVNGTWVEQTELSSLYTEMQNKNIVFS